MMNMILKDLFSSQFPFIDDVTIDIYLTEYDLGDIISKPGRMVSRRKVVCVLANKHWSDREVQKYSEHELDHFEYFQDSRQLYVYLKGDLEI